MFPDDLSGQKKKLMATLGTAEVRDGWTTAYRVLAGTTIEAARGMPKAA